MHIYPAIDLKDGQGVRLLHGDFKRMTVYAPDPRAQAEKFIAAGCEWIHVVDLDGALKGQTGNRQAVTDICQTGARIQLGGGIRTMEDIENWLTAGISRVILGTIALKNPKLVIKAAKAFPNLGNLLRRVLIDNPELKRLRLSSIDPAEIDDELMNLMCYEKRLLPHFHFSIQSGDNLILKRMKRRHNREDVIKVCKKIKKIRKEVVEVLIYESNK